MHEEREVREHRLDSWESFETKVADIDRETDALKLTRSVSVSEPLYRGQRDASWGLQTTLDRQRPGMTLGKYLTLIERMQPRIERISGSKWPILSQEISGLRHKGLPCIPWFTAEQANTKTIVSFMVYLRQHGFPSPLLDWTSAPYKAAFFAYAGFGEGTERVAIFTFRRSTGTARETWRQDEPTAMSWGPCILNTSRRHSKQDAQYTWCLRRPASGLTLEDWVFADHEQAINLPGFRMEAGTDVSESRAANVVEKYTIPASERRKVLASLAVRNINRCRLFGLGVDSLLEDLWNELVVDFAV
jgi:hypothetical protein